MRARRARFTARSSLRSDRFTARSSLRSDGLSSKLVRCQFATFVLEHLDRQASSESSFQHSGNAFGSTGAERDRISALTKCIWLDRRRARAHLGVPERHLDRQASSESACQYSGNAFGSAGVDREHCCARREFYLYCFGQQSDGPFRSTKQVLLAFC